ncbi:light-regulated signal transduction histidine kinase (bacteriophytochrome) [Tenacibaculum adriaticum]|uniref:histidine kinase n=1 Tax=Tenacibaculum adriaticum TaxID=413713 RepID=A0A5S5DQK7_9FLAO|nr:ATP-binding protein [Tenacibaculum adriaticum]TYP97964.1 light-regulated signal transduction histidine kinase (bacteriophytochrome) [Tenacibaculum adriaticum]
MNFRNITNRDIVNLENCEDEPIHIPGLIQPHGFLISVDFQTNIINVCSENINNYIDFTYQQLLGKEIKTFFNNTFLSEFNIFKKDTATPFKAFNFSINERLFSISLHHSDNAIIIEGEPTENQFDKDNQLYNSSKQLLSYIEDTSTLKELCNSVVLAIKNITNYDRVMVYRFDAEYNGEIIAESKEEHLEPFLGLHYPHTDIPVQARELYIKNHLRIIGDVDYKPVELFTYNLSPIKTLDLSLSILRSVSPIHIQYLHNMGVGATLTVSLIHKGKLWGLIACHHYSPKYLSQDIRNTVKLHGHFITSQIDVRLLNEQYEIAGRVNAAVERLTSKKLAFNRSSIIELFNEKSIVSLCNSAGVSALIDGELYIYGETPNNEEIQLLGDFLYNYSDNGRFVTSSLSHITSNLKSISEAFPGINYYSLGDETNFIIWYRTPTIKDIHWAGDPSKSIEKDTKGLSPRKSFAKFTENVKDTCKPWLEAELAACSNFFNFFQIHIRSIIINEEKENQKKLSEILKETNAELENINWISTHDLQEPLRKIRMMASTLLRSDTKNPLPENVHNKIIRMQNSAERMQTLISDILKYTKANVDAPDFEMVDLHNLLIQTKEEMNDTLNDTNASLKIEPLPHIKGVPFLLKQLFLNTIYNSLKFSSPERDPIIVIKMEKDSIDEISKSGMYHVIEVKDNGIGFNNAYKEKIFKIFSRLNNKSDYSGSGIGLALCKKIMIKHQGFIDATGTVDKGATIKLYFPKN